MLNFKFHISDLQLDLILDLILDVILDLRKVW